MSILITGGAGYIGSHTVKELRAQDNDVVIFDNLSRGHREAAGDTPLVVGDLRDPGAIGKVFADNEIEAVIHFAADSQVGESVKDPQKYYSNNIVGTLTLLQAMLDADVKQIVFSSSAATYGEPKEMPIKEDVPQQPTNPYGQTKLIIENVLADYDKAYGLQYIALRYFNVAGADPDGEVGEDHRPETHLIPIILEVAAGKRDHLELYGTDYPTEDGTCIRDYIHVTDLSQAHILALDHLAAGKKSQAFNLGNGNGFSNRAIIDVAKKVTGKDIKVIEAERRAGDPAKLVASSVKIMKELGWKPKYNSLEKIVETAWNWQQSHPEGYKE
ncbi:UDP-glucose 4-epimerase GalE [Patescibacteria group bacterium]